MKPWTRDDTRDWISQLENRINDIDYYLSLTTKWCEEHDIYDDRTVFLCAMMTTIWVCYLRGELISTRESFEILGVENWDEIDDEVYEFNPDYANLDHSELLKIVISTNT